MLQGERGRSEPGGPSESPVFLVGSERSGSTLLRLMLDHHPEIAFEHEFDIAVELVSDSGELPEMDAYRDYLQQTRGMRYSVDPELGYRDLVGDFLEQKRTESGGKAHVGATVHHHFDRLLYVWPDARFIHLIRDPRDVSRSVVQREWAGNLYHASDWWSTAERCWDGLVERLTPGRYIEVAYEELVAHPQDVLARVCDFLGVDFDPAMLSYTDSARQYPEPTASLANQWRRKLGSREIRTIESRLWPLAESRGYQRHTEPAPKSPGRVRHHVLMLHSRVIRYWWRIRRYGVGVTTMDLIGRRLHLENLMRAAQRRINEIDSETIAMESAGLIAPSANMPTPSDPASGGTPRPDGLRDGR